MVIESVIEELTTAFSGRQGRIVLKQHQIEAIFFLHQRNRAILADRRGVGKTYPALVAMRMRAGHTSQFRDGPPMFLYVCPAYQIEQNARKIIDVLPNELVVTVQRGDPEITPVQWADEPGAQPATWVIVSYHTLTNDGLAKTSWLAKTLWDGIIFDEGHRLRRRQNQWTKAAKRLASSCPAVYLLTGTPQVKDPGDYWAQLNVLDPKNFTSYWNFVSDWCRTWQSPWKIEILGLNPLLRDQFAQMLSKYMLRRDITLPDPTEYELPIEIEPSLLREHKKAKQEWMIQYPDLDKPVAIESGGALVTRLRQLTAHSDKKLQAVVDILEDIPDEQAIAYTWFRGSGRRVADYIADKADRNVVHVDGSIPPVERAREIERWKTIPDAVLVATIPSVQEGLDLQNAATAIFFEVPYTWSDTDQAIGRVHREGQTRQVAVHYVRAKGTIDDSVHRVMTRRRNQAEDLENAMRAILEDLRQQEGLPS